MKIGASPIGPGHKPYIIAELGVNHDGSLDRAIQLTRAAAEAGADAVKLQLFDADMLMSRAASLAEYQAAAGESDPLAMLRRLQLSLRDMEQVVTLAHQLDIDAIVTVFSAQLVDRARRLDWDAYKLASPDITNRPLMDALLTTGKPVILSTGASTLREVGRALEWLRPARGRVAALQCVSSYPTALDCAELGGITAIRDIFDGPVGYSDHTTDQRMGAWAVAHGASILEKHVTYDKSAQGPDHEASFEPSELRTYRKLITSRGQAVPPPPPDAIGPGKRVLKCEADVRRLSRQSLTATRELNPGERIAAGDLTVKRPGTGIEPYRLNDVVGMTVAARVEADTPLMSESLVEFANASRAA